MTRFTGKTAVITGASRGIGLGIARRLASEGASLALIGTNPETISQTAADIQTEFGVKALGYAVNVADTPAVTAAFNQILTDFGSVDFLVNNAGINRDTLLMRMSEEDWDAVIDTDLKGVFNCVKAISRSMMKARFGRIVTISSIIGISGNAGQLNYAAAKAGVIGLTKSLARELASRNITANAVAPGFIHTDMTAKMPEQLRQEAIARIPLGREGTPGDIAGTVAFLLSDDASFITGQVIVVDGGML